MYSLQYSVQYTAGEKYTRGRKEINPLGLGPISKSL